jgi:nicotinate phosphoribosyltransferase
VVSTGELEPGPYDRSLLRPLVRGGEIIGREPLAEARARHERALGELPPRAFQLSRGDPAVPTEFLND